MVVIQRPSLLALVLPAALLAGGCDAIGGTLPGIGDAAQRKVAAAQDGQTVVVPPGTYGRLALRNVTHARPVTVRLDGVTLGGIDLVNVTGLHFVGGTVNSGDMTARGIDLRSSQDIRIENMTVTGAMRGIVVTRGHDIALVGNRLTGLRSDGINLGFTRKVLVQGNSCSNFSPIPGVYAEGRRIRDGDHPDCIQAWSRPTDPPVADIVVEGNRAEGHMQGVFFGNGVRNGVDDGGYDRIRIEHNKVRISFYNGVVLGTARDSVVRYNDVTSIPGSVNPRTGGRVNANISARGSVNTVLCGNRVPDVPRNPANAPCS